jgi:hypothetical protein
MYGKNLTVLEVHSECLPFGSKILVSMRIHWKSGQTVGSRVVNRIRAGSVLSCLALVWKTKLVELFIFLNNFGSIQHSGSSQKHKHQILYSIFLAMLKRF